MHARAIRLFLLVFFVALASAAIGPGSQAQKDKTSRTPPTIPKTWDEEAIASLQVPLADASASPVQISADYYYRMPVRPIYKSYPVYAPGKEPPGYGDWLKQQEPEIVFDAAKLKSEADWIKAGEVVFDAPIAYDSAPQAVIRAADVRNPAWYEKTGMPVARDGVLPFARYVVRKKGEVVVGNLSCSMCHTRVMPDGSLIKGAQGNFPFDRAIAFIARTFPGSEQQRLAIGRTINRLLFAAPWLRHGIQARADQMSAEESTSASEAVPPGALARHGTSPFSPVQVPDLIGVKERRYLDRTGLIRHRNIGDLMRYAAFNQDTDLLARYGDFRPIEVVAFGKLPAPATLSRYSDEQLYALALYVYSLKAPPNPNKRTALAVRGEKVFQREGCAACHTPPLYTNNKLTPADGFNVPDDHRTRFDILPISVGADPTLTLQTRRGTGYYKVPSLKGVWYRSPVEHNGSLATLERDNAWAGQGEPERVIGLSKCCGCEPAVACYQSFRVGSKLLRADAAEHSRPCGLPG